MVKFDPSIHRVRVTEEIEVEKYLWKENTVIQTASDGYYALLALFPGKLEVVDLQGNVVEEDEMRGLTMDDERQTKDGERSADEEE